VRLVFFIDSRPQAGGVGYGRQRSIRLTCGGRALWDRDGGGGEPGVAWGGGKN
jgi:hypothetical protein